MGTLLTMTILKYPVPDEYRYQIDQSQFRPTSTMALVLNHYDRLERCSYCHILKANRCSQNNSPYCNHNGPYNSTIMKQHKSILTSVTQNSSVYRGRMHDYETD